MHKKHKILYIFYSIITLGIFNLVIRKAKIKKRDNVNNLSINIDKLLVALGSKQNISFVEANMSRLKVGVNDISLVDIETLKKDKHISGVLKQSLSVTLIVGASSFLIMNKIKEVL